MTKTIEIKAPDVSILRPKLLVWYAENARRLPWRVINEKADPYRVWVSEVMLQQTTVAHALPYFEKFMKLWPQIETLAAAEDAKVMAEWAGLGYYSRARNLLKCAQRVVIDYGGVFPQDEAKLLKLPSFGPYTAAAIMAFAFDEPSNVVDGNIERIMSRLYAVDAPMPAAKRHLRDLAALWVRPDQARDWPQALMDLSNAICRPKSPSCGHCPLSEGCAAFKSGQAELFPKKLPKAQKPVRFGVVFVSMSEEGVIVERRSNKGLLGGMLGLPHLEWRGEVWTQVEIDKYALENKDLHFLHTHSYSHVFTHFTLNQQVFVRKLSTETLKACIQASNRYQILPWAEASALPTVFAKALKQI
jgi:A/G-specific adenine glycosylase